MKIFLGAIILISLFGIPWATVMILPFSIVGISVKENESGLYMGNPLIFNKKYFILGILNIFVVLPQLLVSITIGFVIEFFNGNIIAAFVVGSISAFLCKKIRIKYINFYSFIKLLYLFGF